MIFRLVVSKVTKYSIREYIIKKNTHYQIRFSLFLGKRLDFEDSHFKAIEASNSCQKLAKITLETRPVHVKVIVTLFKITWKIFHDCCHALLLYYSCVWYDLSESFLSLKVQKTHLCFSR